MSSTRKKMPAAERTDPDRSQFGMFRNGGPAGDSESRADTPRADRSGADAADANGAGASGDDAQRDRVTDEVTEGLAAAYRIAEEQLEQGRKYAESLFSGGGFAGGEGKSPFSFTDNANGAPLLMRQVLEFYTELSGRCLDFAFELARNPEVACYAQQFSEANAAPATAGSAAGNVAPDTSDCTELPTLSGVEIIASVPVEVELNLFQPCDVADLHVPGMLCVDGAQTLTGVDLFATNPNQVRVRVVLTENQLPGEYTGTVMQRSSRAAIGVIGVRVHHKA
jgi:hypothetical protein